MFLGRQLLQLKLGLVVVCNYTTQTNEMQNFLSPLNAELNPICHSLALLGAHHILHVRKIRVNTLFIISLVSCMFRPFLVSSSGGLSYPPDYHTTMYAKRTLLHVQLSA
jgi:hypothetical protein